MPPRSLGLYLDDILAAVGHVRRVSAGLTQAEFFAHPDPLFVAERNLMTIGEALAQMKNHFPETFAKIPEGNRIVAFRNILVHAYASIDPEIVWSVIQSDLERLHQVVATLERETRGQS